MDDYEHNSIFIQSVAFGSEAIEVTYMEGRDSEAPVAEIRTLIIPGAMVMEELAEVTDAIEQLIDRALTIKRSPPERIRHAR